MDKTRMNEQDTEFTERIATLDSDETWTTGLAAFLTKHRPEIYAPTSNAAYKSEFQKWVNESLRPHAFVTINLPHERHARRMPRDAQFYLKLWTRQAEADLLGRATLNDDCLDHRMLWIFRREEAPDGLVHYHGIVRFPQDRPWKNEPTSHTQDLAARCSLLQSALQLASTRTPEPFTTSFPTRPKSALQHPTARAPRLVKQKRPPYQPPAFPTPNPEPAEAADIDVRPYDAAYHAPYLLKGMWNSVPNVVQDESTWESGLIILPHRPKDGKRTRRRRQKRRTPFRPR